LISEQENQLVCGQDGYLIPEEGKADIWIFMKQLF
jgi:hypothetical protein